MTRLAKLIFLLIILSVCHTDAKAQGQGPVILTLPANTRAMAMGNSFQLADPTGDILFYNPSLLVGSTSFTMSRHTFGKEASLLQMSAKTEWWKGAVAVGIQSLGYSKNINNIQPVPVSQTERELSKKGLNRISESVATVGYGWELAGLDWGISGKIIGQGVGGSKGQAYALDFGGSKTIGPFTIGLAHQNIGNSLKISTSEIDLENQTTLGAGFHNLPLGPFDVGASAAVSKNPNRPTSKHIGGEISWWPVSGRTFTGRIGMRSEKEVFQSVILSFGLGFKGDAFGIDYAFSDIDGAGNAHRISVSWQ